MKEQKNIGYRVLTGLLILLNVLFLVYYVGLSFYSRFHYDDLHFLWKLQEMSSWEYMTDMYFSRSGRFMGYLQNALHSNFILLTDAHWLLPIGYYLLGVWLTYIPLRKYMPACALGCLNAVVLFYNIYVLTNIDYPIFTWTCATCYLILMPLAFILWHLIQKHTKRWHEWVVIVLLSVLLGGGQEAFTPMVLCLYFVYGLYLLRGYAWKIKDAWQDVRVKKLIGVAALILAAWIIVVIAPGNYERMSDTSQFIHPSGVLGWIKGMVSALGMFTWFETFYVPYYLIVAGVFVMLGYAQRDKTSIPFTYRQMMITSTLVWTGYLVISVIPFVYLWGGFGIQRNYTPAVYITLFTLCFWGFLYGYFRLKDAKVKVCMSLVAMGMVGLICIQMCNNVADLPTARVYAKAVDERVEYLQGLEAKGQRETVIVEALPTPSCVDTKYVILSALGKQTNKPVLYYISDAEETPNEYMYHFKRVYKLNFDFVLAQPEE